MKKAYLSLFKNWKEAETFFLVLIVLTAVFSYPFRSPLYVLVAVFLVLLLNVIFTKMAAHMYGTEAELKLWVVRRYGFGKSKFTKKSKLKRDLNAFPAGVFFPLLFSIFTKGFLPFALVSNYSLKETHYGGRLRAHLLEWDHAKILFFGMVPLMLLIPFFSAWSLHTPQLILVLFLMGQLIPVPGSSGLVLLFSSFPLYLFLVTFFFAIVAILSVINIALIIILAGGFAALVTLFYYYNFIYP